MLKQVALVFATVTLSTVAFAQGDGFYQLGFAANLNIGDSEVNISNDGARASFYNNSTNGGLGNLCANVYVFDPSEEEVACCSCLVTPNALVSLSAKNDLVSNVLTPAIPTSIVIKIVASVPATSSASQGYTICNPTTSQILALHGPGDLTPNDVEVGLIAWGATLEPTAPTGTYAAVHVPFIVPPTSSLNATELGDLSSVCNFVQQEGSNFGVCNSCALGALKGTKQ